VVISQSLFILKSENELLFKYLKKQYLDGSTTGSTIHTGTVYEMVVHAKLLQKVTTSELNYR
jgi:hypothetical protein